MKNSVTDWAISDISEYMQTHKDEYHRERYYQFRYDFWDVHPNQLRGKKTVRLNRQLGIHKLNFGKHNMNRY